MSGELVLNFSEVVKNPQVTRSAISSTFPLLQAILYYTFAALGGHHFAQMAMVSVS